MKTFTFIEIAHWRVYEKVRDSGEFNMFDPRAQQAARLSDDQYIFVMNNYTALKEAALQEQAE